MSWGQLYGVFHPTIINLVSESINFLFYFDVWTGYKIVHGMVMDGYGYLSVNCLYCFYVFLYFKVGCWLCGAQLEQKAEHL